MATKLFTVTPAGARPSTKGTVLYSHTLCPYAERAWLALLEKVRPCTDFQLEPPGHSVQLAFEICFPGPPSCSS